MFYRLIKPDWAKQLTAKKEPNPDFIQKIDGPDVIEGCLTEDEVSQLNHLGYNAYFFPNHPKTNVYQNGIKHLSGKHIETFNYVFVDMDLKDGIYKSKQDFLKELSNFPIKPTITVESGNGVHAYWRINNLSRDQYVITQMALINKFKTDESVWTVLQLMRVPGSLNTKQHNNFKQTIINEELSSGEYYDLTSFPDNMWLIPEERQVKAQNHLNKLDGKLQIQLNDEVNIDELPDSFIDLMMENENIYQLFNNPVETYGDRSGADMKLANILFNKQLPKKDALLVLANTNKALSKGPYRNEYAQATIDKAYVDRTKNKFMTVGQRLKQGFSYDKGSPINGPYFWDTGVLENHWKKGQVLGLIAGSGVGKTSITLKIIKDTIQNNFNVNDDVFVFITLEMPEQEIVERWINLVGKDSELADRLYVIGNEDEKGEPRNIGLQEIYEYCNDIKMATGKEIGALAIDHFGLISCHIDIRKKYTFGINSEKDTGWGDIKTISKNMLATQIKSLAKMLNTFPIVLTQTTKEKGAGDTPIDKDGAYGVSQYENIMDYIITAWQPLMRIQERSPHYFLAWQYVKIRHKHKLDKIKTHQQKLLTYEMDTGDLRPTTESEYMTFTELLPEAIKIREELAKKKTTEYSRSLNLNDLKHVTQNLHIVQNK